MRTGKLLYSLVGLSIAGSLALAGCSTTGGTSSSGADDEVSVINVAITSDPRSLMPNSSTAQSEITVSEQIVEKLIEAGTDGTGYEARLAESWEQIDDSTVRLTLRQGVSFTNGEPFDADSVVYSINEVFMNADAYSSSWELVKEAVKVDDYTVDIISPEPTGLILNALARGSFMYPKDYFAETGADGFGEAPIGTGPYVLSSWTKGDNVTLDANPDYWGGAAEIDQVVFKVIPDKTAQIAAAQTGDVDLFLDIPVGSIDQVESTDGVSIVSRPSSRIYYLFMSELTDTPMKDQAVRKALWYAIDTQSLIDQQLGGYGSTLKSQLLSDAYFGYDDSLPEMTYDPDKAKELLAEAGYPDGFEVTFKYSSGRYAQDLELGQAIAAQLAEVGINVTQEPLESGTFLTQLLDLELNDISMMGALTAPDAYFMYNQFVTDGTYSYYSNEQVDALLSQALTESDEDTRQTILSDLSKVFIEDPAYVPLFQGEDLYLVSDSVEGFSPRASQFIDMHELSVTS